MWLKNIRKGEVDVHISINGIAKKSDEVLQRVRQDIKTQDLKGVQCSVQQGSVHLNCWGQYPCG